MPLSLVPPDGAPSPEPDIEEMPEEEARAFLMSLKGERLDAFRIKVPTMRTSELIAHYSHPEIIAHMVMDSTTDERRNQQVTMAAVLAVADEIDRRIPTK